MTYFRNRFVIGFSLLLAGFFFLTMLFSGAPLGVSVQAAILMGVMSAGITMMSYRYRQFLQQRSFTDKKQANQSMDHHQTRTVEIDLPHDQAYDLVLSALQTLDNQPVPVPDDILVRLENVFPRKQDLRLHHADRQQGEILAGLKARVLGIPEFFDFSRIRIQLESVSVGTTRIHIESKTNNIFDPYDFGKNLHYVNEISLYLRRESQAESATMRLGDRAQITGFDAGNFAHDEDVKEQ